MPIRIMSSELKNNDNRARQNLRIDPCILDALDSERFKRGGFVSRHTWIMEAILEKLAREQDNRGIDGVERKIHVL